MNRHKQYANKMRVNKDAFQRQVREAINKMHPLKHDSYIHVRYSDTLIASIWSHPDGEGVIEVEVIVTYEHNGGYPEDANQLTEIENTETLYNTLIECLNETTTDDHSETPFHLIEQVNNGEWDEDANVYSTHSIRTELTKKSG